MVFIVIKDDRIASRRVQASLRAVAEVLVTAYERRPSCGVRHAAIDQRHDQRDSSTKCNDLSPPARRVSSAHGEAALSEVGRAKQPTSAAHFVAPGRCLKDYDSRRCFYSTAEIRTQR